MNREQAITRYSYLVDDRLGCSQVIGMADLHKIFDALEAETCTNCKYYNKIDSGRGICANDVSIDITTQGQYIVTEDFKCNKWENIK